MKPHRVSAVALVSATLVSTYAGPPRRGDFPGYGFIPKEDTGALRFLHAHPDYDGRGTVVAIFDTGVDPGAPGLQVTSDGKPKIIDMIDGGGSGDVNTSTIVSAENGVITGLTGRTLKINPAWNNPRGEYRIGIKRAYEIYPGRLKNRLRVERQEKFDERQRITVTELERALAVWDAKHPQPTKEQLKEREELDARLEQLGRLHDEYDDPGPVFDCVVFHDGEVWRAAIDTDEDGDLADEKAMTHYRLEREFATFSEEDLLNFTVNIYDEGNLLSIVTDVGSHGTHVAGIVAAYFPDQPELNGLAPGAQIVAVKIGDNRLNSNSCATGEVRGCISVLQNDCDLINLSYGEPSADPDVGRNSEIYSEIVNEHGVIFVSSAGNEGPALSTVGYPGSSTEALLGVGAYVSPEMMAVQYAMREQLPANQYTWSTRGPSYDGALAVNFSAPGGAIAPVPNWVLQRNTQMHGTSMSSPNACGNIALLLSALKAEGIPYSPHSVRRALENTAQTVPGVEVFAQGRGLIQIDRAYEYLRKFHGDSLDHVRFDVRIPRRGNARGIYLREPFELERPVETRVTVTPRFPKDADNRAKVDFELKIALESNAHWVSCAEHLLLMHGGRRMDIEVDPTRLRPGAHYAEIRGYDSVAPERGPLFRVPITVVIPETDEPERTWDDEFALEAGQVEHRFLTVPQGATWVDFRVRRLDEGESRVLVLHALELVPGQRYIDYQLQEFFRLAGPGDAVFSMPVVGGRTLEVCLAQYWSSLGKCECHIEATFHGIVPDRSAIGLHGGEVATRMHITTPLRRERVEPEAELDTLRRTIRPKTAEIRPLNGFRDKLPEERQIYELVLTYEFSLDEAAKITPRVAMLEVEEYQEGWQSLQYMIFNSAKRMVERWGLVARSKHLEKGDYVLRYHVRHDDLSQLEKLEDMALLLDRALKSPVRVQFHADPDDALAGQNKYGTHRLQRGETAVLWVAGPDADDLPEAAKPGDVLMGTVTFGGKERGEYGAGRRPGGYPVMCVIPPKPIATEDPVVDEDDDDDRSEKEQLAEAIRDLKVERLAELHGEDDRALFDRIAVEVLRDYPDHLPVLVARLDRENDPEAVVDVADAVIAAIDQSALAAHYGLKLGPDDKQAAKARKEMDERKQALVEALHRKAQALFDLAAHSHSSGRPESDADAEANERFETAFTALEKWVDTTDDDYLMLHIDRAARQGRPGEALGLLSEKIADSKPDQELRDKQIELLDQLGWTHWREYETQWNLIRFPKEYPPL